MSMLNAISTIAVFSIGLLLSPSVKAGPLFSAHGLVDAYGELGHFHVRNIGNGYLDTGSPGFSYSDPTISTGETARAQVQGAAGELLKASSSSFGSSGALFAASGYGEAVAAWQDIAFVNSANVPSSIRLTFAVDGSLLANATVPLPTAAYVFADIGITALSPGGANVGNFFDGGQFFTTHTPETAGFAPLSAYLQVDGFRPSLDGFYTNQEGGFSWDTASFDGLNFTGTFHLDVPYDPIYGGFVWGIALHARSKGKGGVAESDFSDTLGLLAVTLPDGTPLDVRFDSGLEFGTNGEPVPEPTSLVILLGFGATYLLVVRIRKSRAAHTQQGI